jgi:protein-L-isoaspartate(D-aspartate) O-methyltransferase
MLEKLRFNMIEQQVRTWDVLDENVLDLLKTSKREDYVPKQFHKLAFADIEIPLSHGEKMLSPKIEGRILQSLEIKPNDHVYHVGTGHWDGNYVCY